MSECKLSILVPFYNVGEFVTPLLDCFEKLTLPEEDYEIIFWNDGSTDQSVDYVKAFLGAKKNRFLYSSSNLGIYPARNKLLNVAKGDYIWFVIHRQNLSYDSYTYGVNYGVRPIIELSKINL